MPTIIKCRVWKSRIDERNISKKFKSQLFTVFTKCVSQLSIVIETSIENVHSTMQIGENDFFFFTEFDQTFRFIYT